MILFSGRSKISFSVLISSLSVAFVFAAVVGFTHVARAAESAVDDDDDTEEVSQAPTANDDDDLEDEVVLVSPFTEEQRLKGFYFHQKLNKQFDEYRLSGAGNVKKSRLRWNFLMAETLPEYKEQKAGEKKTLDETSPAYKKDLKKKNEYDIWLEGARRRYVQARNKARDQQKKSVSLSDSEEYDLLKVRERVDIAKRSLYVGKVAKSKTDTSSSNSSGATTNPPNPGFESTPAPPPMPSTGDFYEPDIPPPPPPPMPMPMDGNGGFEDSIQPPIFDEPEF